MNQWRMLTSSHVNSATAKSVGLQLDQARLYGDAQSIRDADPIIGSYRQLVALARQLRWEWISYNGYNPIIVTRASGRITYHVYAHFNMPAYDLCVLERVTPDAQADRRYKRAHRFDRR